MVIGYTYAYKSLYMHTNTWWCQGLFLHCIESGCVYLDVHRGGQGFLSYVRSPGPCMGILGTYLYGIWVYVCIHKLVYAYKHMGCQAFFPIGFFIVMAVYT